MNVNVIARGSVRVLSAALPALLLTAAVAGCSGSEDGATDISTDETSETTDTSEATTSEPTGTTGTAETTDTSDTTAAPTTTATTASTVSTGSSDRAGAPVPDGSGCSPGYVDTLPDGLWFGYASSREADSFSFDLACWFTGDDAVLAASEDGAESPPPNDYHIRNDNTAERLLIPAPDVTVEFLGNPGDPASAEIVDYPTWVAVATDRAFEPAVWVEIEDGLVVTIKEQYQP